jgi:hypothetical protein
VARTFQRASAHTSGSAARACYDSKYGPRRAFVPQKFSRSRATCNVRLQALRFQKQRHTVERALTLRTR